MKIPLGKTRAKLKKRDPETYSPVGTCGYIDGYTRLFDDEPYAVFVAEDGYMHHIPISHLIAIFEDLE